MTPRWPRWMLAALLAVTAVLYLWNLSASGFGNTYYAAAAQAGAQSWSAWFFGSLDAAGFVTVDKPPAALWLMGLSVRIFGMNPLAVLAPQAAAGVASVAVLYATMRRTVDDASEGAAAGLLAGAALAATPAAALMFRFDTPDALLVLLTTVAAYALIRAVRATSWRWLIVVGAVVGLAFLTKMLQALLVVPGFAAAYLCCAAAGWRRRIIHLAGAVAAVVVAAGWWVAVVTLIPSGSRPYVGGSTDDSILDLVLGYNGADRILGHPSQNGETGRGPGLTRLFSGEMAIEISWLLPVALVAVALGVCLAVRGRLARVERAALIAWAGWLLVTGVVLSFMRGTAHPYYGVALAPAVAALVGLGATWAWRARGQLVGRVALPTMVIVGVGWSSVLLHRNHFGPSWVVGALVAAGALAVVVLVIGRRLAPVGAAVGVTAVLAGSVAVTVATAATPHHGTIPLALGAVSSASWMGDEADNRDLADLLAATGTPWSAATNGAQSAAVLEIASGTSVMAVGGWSDDPVPTLAQFVDDVHAGRVTYWVEAGRAGAARPHGEVLRSENHSTAHTREIADWVAATYPATAIGDSLVYRLIR